MKKFYFILITLLIGMTAWSQTKTWAGGGSGSWTVATNWSPAGVPAANSRIIFNDGSIGLITNVPALNIDELQITNGSEVTLRGASLTINNAGGADLVIATGSVLVMSTGVNITLAAGASATIAGTLE